MNSLIHELNDSVEEEIYLLVFVFLGTIFEFYSIM